MIFTDFFASSIMVSSFLMFGKAFFCLDIRALYLFLQLCSVLWNSAPNLAHFFPYFSTFSSNSKSYCFVHSPLHSWKNVPIFGRVKVVVPMFPTVLSSSKIFFIRLFKKLSSHLIPWNFITIILWLQFVYLADNLNYHLVLIRSPVFVFRLFLKEKSLGLISKEYLWFFIKNLK